MSVLWNFLCTCSFGASRSSNRWLEPSVGGTVIRLRLGANRALGCLALNVPEAELLVRWRTKEKGPLRVLFHFLPGRLFPVEFSAQFICGSKARGFLHGPCHRRRDVFCAPCGHRRRPHRRHRARDRPYRLCRSPACRDPSPSTSTCPSIGPGPVV